MALVLFFFQSMIHCSKKSMTTQSARVSRSSAALTAAPSLPQTGSGTAESVSTQSTSGSPGFMPHNAVSVHLE